MAITATLDHELEFGNKRGKFYTLKHDGSATTVAIDPGAAYFYPVGDFREYGTSGTTATLKWNSAPTSGTFSHVFFVGPV